MAGIALLKHGPIAEIRLKRPRVLNAMGRDWPPDMQSAINAINANPEIRVALMTAEGRSFCSGVDLTQLASGKIQPSWFHDNELVFRAIETMDKPVIAGIQGYCIGGGLQIAIACDVRIAADDAILGLPAAKEAFLPGMSAWRLVRLIGMGHARHLILSGQNIDPHEAYRIGLVNLVVPRESLERELEAMAKRYLEVPAPSLKWAKRLTSQAFDLPFELFLDEFDKAMEVVLASDEHQVALRAWRERKSGMPQDEGS
jgi:enoyl-CoA hydratase/carnithine racemase